MTKFYKSGRFWILLLCMAGGFVACLPGIYSSYDFTEETGGNPITPSPDPSPSPPEPQEEASFVARQGFAKAFHSASYEAVVGVNVVLAPDFDLSAASDFTTLRPAWEIY